MLRRAPVEVPVERDLYDGWLAAGGDWPPADCARASFEAAVPEPPAERGLAGPDGRAAFAYFGG
jgi:hypothetical protein